MRAWLWPLTRPTGGRPWPLLGVAILAAIALGWVASGHPGLRLVDFLGFSARARQLPASEMWVHPLYPVGYPALLRLGQALTGDVLLAGKALAVVAGVVAVASTGGWLGLAAGGWLLVQAGLLNHAGTEGTDLLAVALGFVSLALARRRPGLAGVALGAACLCRYTAITALPAVWLLATHRPRLLGGLVVATLPHWGAAALLGVSPLPDQSVNIAIASGGAASGLWDVDTLRRWPGGIARAWAAATLGWPTLLGALGLLVGLVRRDRRALALVLWAVAHLALVGLAFANGRLVLPATLALALGVCWLLPRAGVVVLSLALGITTLPLAHEPTSSESDLVEGTAACAELSPPLLATSPWFHARADGWLIASTPVQGLAHGARDLSPDELRPLAEAAGYRSIVVDAGRVKRTYPQLSDLQRERQVDGFEKVCEGGGFKGYRIAPASGG